ncbi:biliverdin-producing heme oxygenase [Luteibacter pinisoli]|uniref:Biliverdin-producing heme oxygenase n=1 Tax=Luteibacter pinisoli TaxID=2589080 RepID=A0A4Y5Z103_9GAMM|nr:biliverdin-producing heme oxygenase [Luteibacter pinisoli]QDE38774.1 biliverdin-producing heme oxygenase [Luteibacter pinisoli]
MDGDAAIAPAHRLLREHTRDAHDAAEATAGMRALLSGAMNEAGYHGLLAAQLRLFVAWEHERAGEITAAADAWAYQSRIPLLETDLSLHGNLPARVISHVDVPPEFWGELYVIEGSTLGGQVIVRQLRTQFPALPHAYYAMGESAPGQWRRFQQVLDRMLPDRTAQSLAIVGAQRMFARFQRTLQDPGHHV